MEFVVGLILVAAIVGFAFAKRAGFAGAVRPDKGQSYTCAKCGKSDKHVNRTLSAWDKGARSFFCRTCHSEWRDQNPAGTRNGGCAVAAVALLAGGGATFATLGYLLV